MHPPEADKYLYSLEIELEYKALALLGVLVNTPIRVRIVIWKN